MSNKKIDWESIVDDHHQKNDFIMKVLPPLLMQKLGVQMSYLTFQDFQKIINKKFSVQVDNETQTLILRLEDVTEDDLTDEDGNCRSCGCKHSH